MKINPLAKHYDRLSAEERFRLILAAGARGDEAEQDRLCQTAPRVTLGYSHHAPWAYAFDQLATLVYMELLEEAAKHQDAYERWCDASEDNDEDDERVDDCEDEDEAGAADEHGSNLAERAGVNRESPIWARMLALYYAQGFILKTKTAGWKLFCERLTLPPFALWKPYPGFDRLERAIDLVDNRQHGPPPAFEPEGMVGWLHRVRPKGQPEPTADRLVSPKRFADDLESTFRRLVEWWGG